MRQAFNGLFPILLLAVFLIGASFQDLNDLDWWKKISRETGLGSRPDRDKRDLSDTGDWFRQVFTNFKTGKRDRLAPSRSLGSHRSGRRNRIGYSEDIILIDGASDNEGTVLVNVKGHWGTICHDHWSLKEANVVCRMLGYPHALRATTRDYFFTSQDHYYVMDDVDCRGDENSIVDCDYWSDNDCKSREEAGVICVNPEPIGWQYSVQTPSLKGVDKEALRALMQQPFVIETRPYYNNKIVKGQGTHLIKAKVILDRRLGVTGPVCLDRFRGAEANVVCRSIGQHFAEAYFEVPIETRQFDVPYPVVTVGHCFGNESRLEDCVVFADPRGSPCSNQSAGMAVVCTSALADLEPDVGAIETSAIGAQMPLYAASCALEENCFPETVYNLISRNRKRAFAEIRHLLRFSSIIHNVGTADFRPHEPRERWVWHDCHMHYHSMKVFTDYQVINAKNQLLAVGHKASFCLEDNECKPGYAKKFICSTTLSTRGDQGISPGCQDNYFSDYDCQWIDISDIPSGLYRFNVIINPHFLVPEISYANNAVSCRFVVNKVNQTLSLSQCQLMHPYDLFM